MAIIGAIVWAVFGVVHRPVRVTILTLVIARSGSGIGRAVVDPTHNSLLADYYPVDVRADVFGFHRMSLAVGSFFGPFVAGLLAAGFSWRVPFIVFAAPTLVFVVLAFRLQEPKRGAWERQAMGAEDAVVADRRGAAVVRRVGAHPVAGPHAAPHLVLAAVPRRRRSSASLTLTSLYYEQVFHLDERSPRLHRGRREPAQMHRHPHRDPARDPDRC